MGDDEEYKNLPTEDKIQHKLWKARVAGYTELQKLCEMEDNPKNPTMTKYVYLLKKVVIDSNAISQEKGLEAVLSFVTNITVSPKAINEICNGLVSKCYNSARAKTKELALEVTMMLIELENQTAVIEELLAGTKNKQPKIVMVCVQAIRMALHQFGPKIVPIGPLTKEFERLLEDRDKSVRDETKQLIIEIYRWIGAALKPQMASLKPVQVAEMEVEFANIQSGTAKPERFMRSEQAKREKAGIGKNVAQSAEVEETAEPEVAYDPMEFIDPVDILSQIPKEFWDQVESTKWQERQSALESLEKLANTPKLKTGDYGNVMKILIHTITKDTNVMLATQAAKICTLIARGLKKGFQSYAMPVFRACLGKFKDKKAALVTALRECCDETYTQLTLEGISEEVLACLTNKNPAIKAEAALLLGRCCRKCPSGLSILSKKMLKILVPPLATTMTDNVPDVREACYECLAIIMLKVGAPVFNPFLGEVDNIKMKKIEEYCEKEKAAPTKSDAGNGSTTAATAKPPAPAKAVPAKPDTSRPTTAPAAKPVAKPGTSGAARPATGKGATASKITGGFKKGPLPGEGSEPVESILGEEAVENKVVDLFGEECFKNLTDPNWKERVSAMEVIQRVMNNLSGDEMPCQAIVRFLAMGKSGLKDTNFQVLKMKLETILLLAEKGKFTKTSADVCLNDIYEKVGDVKSGEVSKAVLTAIAEQVTLEYVGLQLMSTVFKQKNLKNQSEALTWLAQAVREFGLKISVKELLKYLRLGFASTNSPVRQAAISLTISLYLFMGDTLRQLLDDEKPALLALIDAEIVKVKDQKPPVPTRGLKSNKTGLANDAEGDAETEAGADEPEEVMDLLPRVNIRAKLSDDVFDLMASKNWKERNEGLEKIQSALSECKFVCGDMSEIFSALYRTCADANKILVKTSLALCEALCKAMTKKACADYTKTLVNAYMNPLGDNKPQIRAAVLSALDALLAQVGLTTILETETITEALKLENPFSSAELCGWLTKSLTVFVESKPTKTKFFALVRVLKPVIPNFFPRLEDRNSEVRKAAQETLMPLMRCLGYDFLVKSATKVCPNSKVIRGFLDKTKDNMPEVPMVLSQEPGKETSTKAESQSSAAPVKNSEKAQKSTASDNDTASSSSKKPTKRTSTAKPVSAKKKEEEVVAQVVLSENNAKDQRFADEKKRKLLKWDFDAPLKEHHAQLFTLFQSNCSPELHAMLFSTDFKQHIKAIEILHKFLEEEIPNDIPATKANFDLILKWMVLRFFETNPAVLIKGLSYLNKAFAELSRISYILHEYEGSSFLPFIVTKLGDSKDNIRKDVRSLLVTVRQVYPVSKLFIYLMEGLRSKVSRQRQECLEELGNIISTFNVDICQPSPPQALKVIAQQIGDRDSGVRTAALNTLVDVYNIVGDQVFKLVGNLTEKDRSMLEERIKRIGNYRGFVGDKGNEQNENEPPPPNKQKLAPRRISTVTSVSDDTASTADLKSSNNADLPPLFRLDFDDSDLVESRKKLSRPLQLHDVEPLLSEVMKPYVRPVLKTQMKAPSLQAIRQSVDATSAIGMVITQITSKDISVSMDALTQIDRVLQNEDIRELMLDHIDQLVLAITMQLKAAPSKYSDNSVTTPDDSLSLLRALLAILVSIFSQPILAKELIADRLKELLHTLFATMLDERIISQHAAERFVQSINVLVTKVIENSNRTVALISLLKLLFECVESGNYGSKLIQLVMKCLWRITRSLRVPGAVQEYQLDAVLYECHLFFKAFPCASWKNRKPDVPLRTVKTFLHSLCQYQGESILQYTKNIPQREETELYSYLLRTLKNSKALSSLPAHKELDGDKSSGVALSAVEEVDKSYSHFLASDDAKLKMIFKQINSGDWELGIDELYDFKETNPDADLSPYLNMNKPYYYKFVELALRRVAIDRKWLSVHSKTKSDIKASYNSTQLPEPAAGERGSAKFYLDRLDQLKKRFNLHVPTSNAYSGRFTASTYPTHDHPMLDSTYQNSMITSTFSPSGPGGGAVSGIDTNLDVSWLNDHPKNEKPVTTETIRSTFTCEEINDLKRRLERIKNENK